MAKFNPDQIAYLTRCLKDVVFLDCADLVATHLRGSIGAKNAGVYPPGLAEIVEALSLDDKKDLVENVCLWTDFHKVHDWLTVFRFEIPTLPTYYTGPDIRIMDPAPDSMGWVVAVKGSVLTPELASNLRKVGVTYVPTLTTLDPEFTVQKAQDWIAKHL
jgi:hypothetical protein